jgi:hypothetical protein
VKTRPCPEKLGIISRPLHHARHPKRQHRTLSVLRSLIVACADGRARSCIASCTVAVRETARGRLSPRLGSGFVMNCQDAASVVLTAFESLALVEFEQSIHQFVEIADHDLIELVDRHVDAVVGDAVLWKIIGADPLTAVT